MATLEEKKERNKCGGGQLKTRVKGLNLGQRFARFRLLEGKFGGTKW